MADLPIDLSGEQVVDGTALRKSVDLRVLAGLKLGPEKRGAFTPLRAGEAKELAGHEVTGMRGYKVEKASLGFAVAKSLDRFEFRCNVIHRERISAVISR
jgi:hypothetical protein